MQRIVGDDHEEVARRTIEEHRKFKEEWFRIEVLIPVETRSLWEETKYRMKGRYGVNHPNEAIENGMFLEYLAAEWLLNPGLPQHIFREDDDEKQPA